MSAKRGGSYFNDPVTFLSNHGLQLRLVTLSPLVDRQLRNLHGRVTDLAYNTRNVVFVIPNFLNGTPESSPPRKHRYHLFAGHEVADVGDDIDRVIRWDIGTPAYMRVLALRKCGCKYLTSPNTLSTIDKHERNDWHIILGFNPVVVLLQIRQNGIIGRIKYGPRQRRQLSKDVPGRGMVFTTLVTGTVLTIGQEKVQVVRPDVVLRKVDDSHRQRSLTVVISCNFGNITDKLGDLREIGME